MEINGYILEGDFQTTGGGNCRWGFAKKEGKRFFIKELLTPVYPTDDVEISDKIRAMKRKGCADFAHRQALIYKAINDHSDGALVHINDFFRCGSHFYVTMPAVQSLPEDTVRSESFSAEDRYRVCRLLLSAVAGLHSAGLIHGDLKPSNILMTKLPSGHITARIIDFEDCYYTSESPGRGESVKGDQRYMAPETFLLMTGAALKLTQAVDVFSLGLIIHEILTGRFPKYDAKYNYPFEAVISGSPLLILPRRLPAPYDRLLPFMLEAEPEKRITLADALGYFGATVRSFETKGVEFPETGKKPQPSPSKRSSAYFHPPKEL